MGRIRMALGAAALSFVATVAVASPAVAAEDTTGQASGAFVDDSVGADESADGIIAEDLTVGVPAEAAPTASQCDIVFYNSWGETCFQRNGDKVWVIDSNHNLKTAYAYWENYLRTSNGTWKLQRWGSCRTTGQVFLWHTCSYNFYEDTTLNSKGGKGSGIRLWICQDGSGCSSNYLWVRNNK
jgi:hypothetical protein